MEIFSLSCCCYYLNLKRSLKSQHLWTFLNKKIKGQLTYSQHKNKFLRHLITPKPVPNPSLPVRCFHFRLATNLGWQIAGQFTRAVQEINELNNRLGAFPRHTCHDVCWRSEEGTQTAVNDDNRARFIQPALAMFATGTNRCEIFFQ